MKVSKETRDLYYNTYMKENFWLKKLKVFLTPFLTILVIFGSIIGGILAGILASIMVMICIPILIIEEFWNDYLKHWFTKLWLHLFIWNKEKMAQHLAYSTMDKYDHDI